MKTIIISLLSIFTFGCSTPELEIKQENNVESKQIIPSINTFMVKWDSNQPGANITFSKYILRECNAIKTETKIYNEKEFEIIVENNQHFDLEINRESKTNNPELHLSIYKGNELLYSDNINTSSFFYSGFVNEFGNIN